MIKTKKGCIMSPCEAIPDWIWIKCYEGTNHNDPEIVKFVKSEATKQKQMFEDIESFKYVVDVGDKTMDIEII